MSKEFKVKIKSQPVKVGTEDYEIRTKGDDEQPVKFSEGKENELSETALKLQYKKKSDSDDKWEDFKKRAKYTGGWFFDDMELENNELTTSLKTDKPIKPGIGFLKSMNWPTYLVIVFVLIAIIGLIWWWVASSKSDDKEEESL